MGAEWRGELGEFARRHEADRFAHAPLLERYSTEGRRFVEETDGRLTALERWQQRIVGVLYFLAFLAGGGALATVIELVRK